MRGIYNMKKKAVCLCLTAAVLLGLVGCGNEKEPPVTIAVVTDGENVDDLAVNQAIWQAVQAYGEKSGERTGYYVPEDEGGAALEQAMDEAVEKGAEVIICHGEAAETAVYEAQREYRDVRFLMFDGEPHAEGSERARLRGNTRCILFEQGRGRLSRRICGGKRRVYQSCILWRRRSGARAGIRSRFLAGSTECGFGDETGERSCLDPVRRAWKQTRYLLNS